MIARLLFLAKNEEQASNFPFCLKHTTPQLTAPRRFPGHNTGKRTLGRARESSDALSWETWESKVEFTGLCERVERESCPEKELGDL